MTTVFILNGPNLNMLGTREPEIYGAETLKDIEKAAKAHGKTLGLTVQFRQSNVEGELVGWIQEARTKAEALILNAGAYTHTSIAILDALRALDKIPVIEVHLSNIFRREEYRKHSYVSEAATGMISGFGSHGYILALDAAKKLVG
jgi:3-dehydroquinate dehydratase II